MVKLPQNMCDHFMFLPTQEGALFCILYQNVDNALVLICSSCSQMLKSKTLNRASSPIRGLIVLLGPKGGLLHGAQETFVYRQDYMCFGRDPHDRNCCLASQGILTQRSSLEWDMSLLQALTIYTAPARHVTMCFFRK